MTLTIHLLGQPRLSLHDNLIKLSAPPKTLPLLAYLLLHPKQVLERQNVAFALWPEESERDARANVRRHIHQLQHALPPAAPDRPWLVGDSRTIGWNPQADFWLDVTEFERLGALPEHLEDAAACYTGDLLETVYDDWVFFERERLLNQYFDILTRLIFQHRTQRDHARAITFAHQLLQRDPFREDVLRQLISLRYESGDRAGALQEYKSFESRLRNEMGVPPMPETQALHERVLHNKRLQDAGEILLSDSTIESRASGNGQCTLLPFVGREIEMERVSAWWSRAARSHGGLSLIGGEAGVGKSRLARQIALLVESQGGRVLIGRTSPLEVRPYQAIVESLQSALPLLAAQDGEPKRLAALSTLIPELKTRCNLPELPSLDAERERLRLFDAVAASVEQLSSPRPLLLLLEDLHWAGEATAALIEFLARRAAHCPILILGTYRDEETPRIHPLRQMRRRLQKELTVEHLALSRLSPKAVDSLLAALAVEELPILCEGESLSARLYAESEGNPLFIEMLLQGWHESGPALPEVVPGGIRAVIGRQLERLSPASRAFAEAAAVLGPAFEAEAAREIGGWDESQAYDALRGLLDSRLAWEAEGRSRFDYLFAHHLIQSVLYGEIPAAKRQRRHLRAAEVLEELHPNHRDEMAGELAEHFDKGGAPAQAIPYFLEAARQRLKVFADQEAMSTLQRALQLADATPVTELRMIIDLLLLQESIHYRRGERGEQRATLLRLDELVRDLNDPELICSVLKRQIAYDKAIDDRPSQRIHIDLLQRQAADLDSRYWQAEALFAEGNYQKITENFSEAISRIEEALAFYRESQHVDEQIHCCAILAEIHIIQRQSSKAETWAQKALTLSKGTLPTYPLLYALWNLSANGLSARDFERCLRHATQLLQLAGQAHDLMWQAAAQRIMGMTFQRQFRVVEARQRLEAALALYQSVQKPKGCALTLQTLGHLEVSLGNYAAAIHNYERAYHLCEGLEDRNGMASEAINLAYAASLQAEYAVEKDYAQRGITLTREIKNRYLEASSLQNLGEAERELGDLPSAVQHLNEALSLLEDETLTIERTSVQADLALVYWKAGNLPLALQTTEYILSAFPKVEGKDDNVHRFLWVAAQILRADGQEERASEILEQAYASFQKDLAAIPEAESQQSFASMRHNREITAAHEQGKWP